MKLVDGLEGHIVRRGPVRAVEIPDFELSMYSRVRRAPWHAHAAYSVFIAFSERSRCSRRPCERPTSEPRATAMSSPTHLRLVIYNIIS
jgi:hypothetical protein